MSSLVGERIRGLRMLNAFGQYFVPIKDLERTMDGEIVKEVLWECGIEVYQREETLKAICGGGIRVFAILCAIEREQLITEFLKHDNFLDFELDSKLPFEENMLLRIIPSDYRRFYDIQWEFSAPIFRPNLHHRSLHNRCLLPFTKVTKIGEGGFGIVSRVLIAGPHQGIVPDAKQEVEVVRKQLRPFSTQEQAYEHEQHILSLLRSIQHPNIIQFYTAYTLNQTRTLLFAPADCDLAEFLSQSRPPYFESNQAIFQALYGLSSAIAHLHNYFSVEYDVKMIGGHYDLKPKNVLVKQGQFILADFGLSRLKSEADGSLSGFKAGVSDYAGPECQDLTEGLEKHRIGRSSDIWSFGCILAEIITFLELGPQGVVDFSEKRKITFLGCLTARPFHASVVPSNAVMVWIDGLESCESATGPRQGLIALTRNMLTFQANMRPNSLNVSARLFLLAQRATVDLVAGSFQILQQRAEFGFKIEFLRFEVWCKSVGILNVSHNRQASTWLLTENARPHFEMISNTLQELVREISVQLHLLKLGPVEPCNSPTYYVLRKHVDSLWNTQSLEMVRRMNSSLEDALLSENMVDGLNSLSLQDSGGTIGPNNYRRIQLLIAMKQAMTSVDEYRRDKPRFLTEEPVKERGEISGRPLASIGTEAGDEKHVLMEVLEYEDKWIDRFDELLLRVDGLVSLLSKPETSALFPILTCVNFCHLVGQQAFGLLYQLPVSRSKPDIPLRPITLVDIIRETKSRLQRPLLDEVFKIAQTLASSLLEFHKAGWLHKGISSFNLLFFPEVGEPVARSITSPYLIGFNHSRESNEFAFTEGPSSSVELSDYQHPEYRNQGSKIRFQEAFDYYSLGIVLLELGQWRPLHKITRKKKTLSAHEIKVYLLQQEVPELGSYMGKIYMDVVKDCISGSFCNGELSQLVSFERNVVDPLFRLSCIGMTQFNG